jgi:hypothetical protein
MTKPPHRRRRSERTVRRVPNCSHITHGETRRGVEQLHSEIEVTADDIAQVIAIVVGRRGALAIHEVL